MAATPVVDIVRVFDAPRELVWKVWTDAAHLARWWGPKDCENPICEIDLRPGGKIRIRMRGPSFDHMMGGEFKEIDPPRRLVFTSTAFEAPDGSWQLENLNTIVFEDLGDKTRLIVRAEVLKASPAVAPALAGMAMGWTQSIERLAALVAELNA